MAKEIREEEKEERRYKNSEESRKKKIGRKIMKEKTESTKREGKLRGEIIIKKSISNVRRYIFLK